MYMVLVLHVLGHGGLLEATVTDRTSHRIAWFFEIAAYCAVNCFALVSGYVGCKSAFKPRNLFRLWLQAVFYTFGITVVFKLLYPDSIGIRRLILSLFPICTSEYWYLTSYALMFFLIPQMNFLLEKQPKELLRKFIWLFFMLFCVLGMIPYLMSIASPVSWGYSAIWLAYLYMIGGFIRIYGIQELIPNKPLILNKLWRVFDSQAGLLFVYVFCVCTTFFLYTAGHFCVKYVIGKDPFCRQFVNYNSPTILFAGVSLLLFFSQLKVSRLTALIQIASPLAFSVYLIHSQQQIWFKLFGGAFKWAADLPSWLLPFAILILPLPIYVLCSIIDYIRLRLFKLLRLA